MADITMLRREMQASTPNTHGALTFMVPAMEGAAKNAGKKSFFGADKGAKALATFLDTFKRAVYALYDDELVSVDDDLPTVFGALSSQLERFAKAYPNWPEAYQFAQFFFSTENRHVHIPILQEVRCEVPCDHIPTRSWPLFRAREVLHGVIESIQREQTT